MIPHVIHSSKRLDRKILLEKELWRQDISSRKMFEAVMSEKPCTGISLSHKQVVSYAKSNGMPEILIMEDDICFPMADGFKYFMVNKPDHFDIYLGGIYFGDIDADNVVKDFAALHCYIIRERFYDTFLASNPEGLQHIDRSLAGKGLFKVCNPFAAIQHNGYSDNAKKDPKHNERLKNYNIYLG